MAVTDENIVGLFAALLAERRVLLTASKLSTVRGAAGQGGRGTDLASCLGAGRRGWTPPLTSPAGRPPRAESWLCRPFQGRVALNAGSTFAGAAAWAAP